MSNGVSKSDEEQQNGKIEYPIEKDEKNNSKDAKTSDKALIIGILVLIALFIAVFSFTYFKKEVPKTIEELHIENLNNRLKPEQGYLYKGTYSFINLNGFWFTQLVSQSGKTLYDLSMRYSPRELENITINGWLNGTLFNNKMEYYVTFNPAGNDFSHVALAVGDFNTHMVNAFLKTPIAACDRNETPVCIARPIITCEDTKDEIVLYINESDNFKVLYDRNCILVQGRGFDLVRGVDRILYNFYDMMEQ